MAEYVGTKDGGKDLATQEDITGGGGAPLSNDAPDALTPDQAGAAGTSSNAARADHAHQINTAAAGTISGSNAEGSSTSFARADHNHALATGVVGSTQIATDAVTAEKIAADAVGSSEIATNAVGSAEIAASAVGTSEIADGAVTGAKLASGSVTVSATAPTSPRVGDLWFDSDNGKLYIYYDSFWVDPASVGGVATTAATTITGTNAEGSSTSLARADHNHALGTDVVTATQIAASAVGTSELADNSVTHAKIATLDGCNLTRLAGSVGSATGHTVPFTTEVYDNGGLHSTTSNTDRITIVTAGIYLITVNVLWTTNNTTGIREAWLRLNGSRTFGGRTAGDPGTFYGSHSISGLWNASVNDYFDIELYQTSGATLNYDARFAVQLTH